VTDAPRHDPAEPEVDAAEPEAAVDPELDAAVAALVRAVADEPVAPMPAAVAARLDAALAAEAAARASAAAGGQAAAETSGATVLAMEPARARRRWSAPSWAGVAAGVAVLALGGAVLAGPLDLFGEGSDSLTAGDAESVPPESFTVADATASGTAYTAAALRQQVATLLTERPAPAGGGQGPTATAVATPDATSSDQPAEPALAYDAARAMVLDKPRLSLCLRAVAAGAAVLAVDAGTYEGAPAIVTVLEVGDQPRVGDVFIVGPACSPADEKVLAYFRVPRP
jgi:hypothetical protein